MDELREQAPPTVLLVDDTPTNLTTLFEILRPMGLRVLVANGGAEALRIAREVHPTLVLLDLVMPEMDGVTTCRLLKGPHCSPDSAVIFVSARHDVEDRVVCLEAGGVDYITRPLDAAEVRARVRVHLELVQLRQGLADHAQRLERELRVSLATRAAAAARLPPALLGQSPAIQAVREWIDRVAATDEALLVWSPAGAGAESVARQVHARSERRARPFIHALCTRYAGRDEDSFFAGASGERSPLGLADGGTLFLELAHLLPDDVQVRVSEAISAGEVDVRLVCSLPHSGRRGLADLHPALGRLLREQVALPTLGQRGPDLTVLASEMLIRAAVRYERPARSITPGSLAQLSAHDWPGNLDELQTAVEQAVMHSRCEEIEVSPSGSGGVSLGSYQLVELIAQGGMGDVWSARHRLLTVPAAVKRIRTEVFGDRHSRRVASARFREEALATAELRSPHTVSLYDFGVSDDGTFYYVMEYLDGLDLQQLVERSGPMPAARVIHLLEQACDSLAEAHRAGLVHQDIKPANLMVCGLGLRRDVLKVVDFGVVKRTQHLDSVEVAGEFCGTPGYIGPEAARGDGVVDHRVDIYALGCVAFFALTGRKMYSDCETAMGLLVRHAREPPEPLPAHLKVPHGLVELVYGCLAKRPEDRPQSARAIGRALRELARAHPWTPDDAEAWWATHGNRVGAARPARSAPTRPDRMRFAADGVDPAMVETPT